MSTLLDRVLSAFTESGVPWALLRGRSDLGTGRDVDLLVADDHFLVAEEIIFGLGGAPLPQRRYPWHHMYVIDIPGDGPNLKLDIVTHLVYNRELMIGSRLERGCLERRVVDDGLLTLSGTDAFWTILLHCVVDKQRVKQDRADELLARVSALDRPSPGEEFFATLCPPGWSPERAVDCVVRRDWQALGDLGSQILSRHQAGGSTTRTSEVPDPTSRAAAPRRLTDRVARRISNAATGAAYRQLWRRLGLGVVPHVLDLVEESGVDATVVGLRRRPGRCRVVLVVDDDQVPRLLAALKEDYRQRGGAWRRVGSGVVETVDVVSASERSVAAGAGGGDPREPSALLPGRSHCRMTLSPGPGRRGTSG